VRDFRLVLFLTSAPITMSQQSAVSSTSTGSFLARAQFAQARRKLFALRLSEDTKIDKAFAREWVELFGKAMVRLFLFVSFRVYRLWPFSKKGDLAIYAGELGAVLEDDTELHSLLDDGRNLVIPFATSDWSKLSPDIVQGVDELVRGLAPGVTLGEAFPEFLPSAVPSSALAVSQPVLAAAPSASSSSASAPSPVMAPPMSSEPSTGSSNAGPSAPESDPAITARPLRPLPRATHRQVGASSSEDAPLPLSTASATVSRTAVPPRPIRVVVPSVPVPSAPVVDSASTAASTRAAKKRAAAGPPVESLPAGWISCTRCRRQKKGCHPAKEADPPFSSCELCLKSKVACTRATGPAGASCFCSFYLFC